MERIAEIFYNSYIKQTNGRSGVEAEVLSDCEKRFVQSLSSEQLENFQLLCDYYEQAVVKHEKDLVLYFLTLLYDDEMI